MMTFLRYVLPLVLAALSMNVYGESVRKELNERDLEAVTQFVKSKRTMNVQEKACNLTIAGDVRFDWSHMNEKQDGEHLLGSFDRTNKDGAPYAKNEFDIMFNLYVDYVCGRAWGVTWLQFNNSAGVEKSKKRDIDLGGCYGSGECDDICLKKAYMGYNLCCDGSTRIDVELGRRPLWTVFDSRIQFLSRFDGLLLKYSRGIECWGDFYVNGGGFVVDQNVNHYAYVVETGMVNIADWGFDVKYSFIDWRKRGENRWNVRDALGWKFRNSQVTLAYNMTPDFLCCMPLQAYAAFLINHNAGRNGLMDHRRSKGWYAGFIMGEVREEGDWSFEANYQYVEAQAIADCDVSGIGRGNVLGDTLTAGVSQSVARGNANYKGWHFEGLYAVTDNLVLDTILEFSQSIDHPVGGSHEYSKFEVQAIYAF